MAFNNGNVISLVNTIRNKDLSGGDFTDLEWSSILTSNSQKLFASLLGIPNLYQLNAPIERRGANVSRKIDEILRPFYKREIVNVVGGVADFATKDIGYLLGIVPSSISGRMFIELQPDRMELLGSSVVAPTAKDPAIEWRDGSSVLVYPSTMTSIVLYYYEFPEDAVVVHTTNSTTLLPVYDTASSTEMGWDKNELVTIAYMCLRDLGINMERSEIVSYADNIVKNE